MGTTKKITEGKSKDGELVVYEVHTRLPYRRPENDPPGSQRIEVDKIFHIMLLNTSKRPASPEPRLPGVVK